MDLPLSDIRVLDVSQIMAGPFCCMLLGDMGADVIKVEPPGVGDQTRKAMGFELKGDDSGGFLALNRNKRSIEIDLKSEGGLAAFYELVKSADVLVENNRPGVVKRLKIDYETLQAINPRLVYASISGFGQTGPWAMRPGLDLIAQAASGAMSVMGHPGGLPVKSSIPFGDLGAGMFAAYGILSALHERHRSGAGQFVDASLLEASLGLSVWETTEFWGTGELPTPIGSANRMSAPYQAVKASDRYFVIGAANQRLWARLCEAIGGEALLDDPRYATNAQRMKALDTLIPSLEALFEKKTAEEWVDILLEAGVPSAPILNYDEATTSPQAVAREMVLPIEHPVEGTIRTLGFPVKLSRTPQAVRHAPPLLGQHTREIMLESGMEAERYESLAAQGAFGSKA